MYRVDASLKSSTTWPLVTHSENCYNLRTQAHPAKTMSGNKLTVEDQAQMNRKPIERPRIWGGGRAGAWAGRYQESSASRANADSHRMVSDAAYATRVAEDLRKLDQQIMFANEQAEASGLTLEPLTPAIGIIIRGIDLAAPSPAQISAVWDLILHRKVVFFRDQGHISRDEQISFAKQFADIGHAFGRQHALSAGNESKEYPEILRLYSSQAKPFVPANWHSDVTWSNRPPLGSLLLSRKSPPVGGDTAFVDAYAMWDTLPPDLKTFLAGRMAVHGRGGRDEVTHPICRTHPVTGRKTLYINPTFTNAICGMEPDESDRLLAQLYAMMYSTPEHGCRFSWKEGSVAMWDNRACQHYAVADFWPYERKMERVTLLDRNPEDEVPFYLDDNGVRHYGEVLTSEAEISTPVQR